MSMFMHVCMHVVCMWLCLVYLQHHVSSVGWGRDKKTEEAETKTLDFY